MGNNIPEINERWNKPVNRIGISTIILCIIATFIPSIYLNIVYDAWLGWGAVGSAFSICIIYFGINWFVEPLSFYPVLGNAGTYLSWLAGSVAQQRVPASIMAKDTLKVTDGTQEAEIVSIAAIVGSIIVNVVVLTITAIVGSYIISILPQVVLQSITRYILPGLFGAMLAMFGCNAPLLTIPLFSVMVIINAFSGAGFIKLPSWSIPLIAIVGAISYSRFLYKKGKIGN